MKAVKYKLKRDKSISCFLTFFMFKGGGPSSNHLRFKDTNKQWEVNPFYLTDICWTGTV